VALCPHVAVTAEEGISILLLRVRHAGIERLEDRDKFGSLVICVTRVFSRISLIFKRIVNIPRGQAGYVGTGDLDSKYRSSAA